MKNSNAVHRSEVYAMVTHRLDDAYTKHGLEPWGRHEFYGILLEEVDELWEEIKADSPSDRMIDEALDVAAVIFRYLETRL